MPPAAQERSFTIWLGGARVGTATERERWEPSGLVLTREEVLRYLREDTAVAITTRIEVWADLALDAQRVAWRQTAQGRPAGEGSAVRARGGGWTAAVDGHPRELPDALPAELVPLHVRQRGSFAGRVLLPARAFAVGQGRVEAVAPGRLLARLVLEGGAVAESTIDVGADGGYLRVVDGDGVIAIRASAREAAEPYPLVDLVAATAVPIAGLLRARGRVAIDGALALPPVPGQVVRSHPASGLALELGPTLPGGLPGARPGPDRAAEVRALVAQVRARIRPDLARGPASADAAAVATAGDCTTYALAYAAHATSRGIATRVITGFRVDGDRLVRHRWAASWTGRAWIAVDAAHGSAPAGGDLIGVAIHEADDAGLVAGEAALAQVRSAAWW